MPVWAGSLTDKKWTSAKVAREIQEDFRHLIGRTGARLHIGTLPVVKAGPIGMRIVSAI